MTLLITVFLVLVNIFNTITTNIPKAEGLTAIEAWVIVCVLFVFGALVGRLVYSLLCLLWTKFIPMDSKFGLKAQECCKNKREQFRKNIEKLIWEMQQNILNEKYRVWYLNSPFAEYAGILLKMKIRVSFQNGHKKKNMHDSMDKQVNHRWRTLSWRDYTFYASATKHLGIGMSVGRSVSWFRQNFQKSLGDFV